MLISHNLINVVHAAPGEPPRIRVCVGYRAVNELLSHY